MPICPRAGLVARVVIPLLLAWRAAPAQSLWRLSDPVVEIGRGESAGFGNVAGAVRRANGGIIATDAAISIAALVFLATALTVALWWPVRRPLITFRVRRHCPGSARPVNCLVEQDCVDRRGHAV